MKWPLVTRKTLLAERTRIRRQLIDHLRQNQRGILCLDYAMLQDVTAPGPITILGESTTVTGSMFLTGQAEVRAGLPQTDQQ